MVDTTALVTRITLRITPILKGTETHCREEDMMQIASNYPNIEGD